MNRPVVVVRSQSRSEVELASRLEVERAYLIARSANDECATANGDIRQPIVTVVAQHVDVRFLGALKSPRDPITCSSLLVVAIAHLVDQLGQTDPGGDAGEADRNNRPIHACI